MWRTSEVKRRARAGSPDPQWVQVDGVRVGCGGRSGGGTARSRERGARSGEDSGRRTGKAVNVSARVPPPRLPSPRDRGGVRSARTLQKAFTSVSRSWAERGSSN